MNNLSSARVKLLLIISSVLLLGASAQAEVLVWYGTWKQVNTRSDGTTTVPGKVTILMDSNTLLTRFIVATKKGGKKVSIWFSDGVGVTQSTKGNADVKTLTSVTGVMSPNFFHSADLLQLSGPVSALPLTKGGTTVDLPKKISGKAHWSRGYYIDSEEYTDNTKATFKVSFQKADTAELNEAGLSIDDAIGNLLQSYSDKGYQLPDS